jgi:GNAT superfamily N-acetyltransferase
MNLVAYNAYSLILRLDIALANSLRCESHPSCHKILLANDSPFFRQVRTAFMIIGLFHIKDGHKKMIGSARVTGDGDTMMLNDVYILKEHQGTGLGVKFLNSVLFGGGRDIWRWLLYTGDRKDWYVTKFGFKVLGNAARSKMVNTPIVVLERDGRTLKFDQEQEQSKTS